VFPDSRATIAAKLDAYHAARTMEASSSDSASQEGENPAVEAVAQTPLVAGFVV
jgi:hypothetical protein